MLEMTYLLLASSRFSEEKNSYFFLNIEKVEADLICKWGCDGSSGQSEYKQKFNEENNSDANIFLTSFVPLQLKCAGNKCNSLLPFCAQFGEEF